MQKLFFEAPTHVRFYDKDNKCDGGIAYHDKVICGCCGAVSPLNLFKESEIEELRWQDISTAIAE